MPQPPRAAAAAAAAAVAAAAFLSGLFRANGRSRTAIIAVKRFFTDTRQNALPSTVQLAESLDTQIEAGFQQSSF